jgi:hypothetical protein
MLKSVLAAACLAIGIIVAMNRPRADETQMVHHHEGELGALEHFITIDLMAEGDAWLSFEGTEQEEHLLRQLYIFPEKSASTYRELIGKICADPQYSCLACWQPLDGPGHFLMTLRDGKNIAKSCKIEGADRYCCAN